MSKIKVLVVLMALLMSVLLLSSCDIGDIFNPGADGTTDQPSQTTPGDDSSNDTGGECTHEFGEWEVILEATCTQKGKQVRVCSLCMHIENSDIDLKAHTVETLVKVDPTCKSEGKTEGEKCSICQSVLKAQEPIPTISHNYDKGICTMCGAEEPACNHTFGGWNTVKDATCADKGLKERSCAGCGEKEQVEIETLPHPEETDQAVAATCTEPGLTEGKHCSVCKEVLIAQETVNANGHKYTEGVCHCGAKDENYIPPTTYSEGLEYELSNDGTYYIVSSIGKCTDTKLVIPSTHENLPVKGIGEEAFYGCSALTDISIPDSIESIGTYAFSGCEKLKTIILPIKLKTIGIAAFYYCSALESITIPENITSIENITFNGCKSLVSIDLPNSVKTIGNSAFAGCEALVEINIPNELRSIGDSAFQNCKSLKFLEFPKTLQSFSKTTTQTPFSGCSALEGIAVHADNLYYLSYKNCVIEKATQTVIFGIGNCELPNNGSVEKIADDALRNLDKLTSIRIPDGTVTIGNRVFYDCNNLREIVIPNSVNSIGYYALKNCNHLETIIFKGTEQEWSNITKGTDWDDGTGTYTIQFIEDEESEEKTYMVTFKDYNGTVLKEQTVKSGESATAPVVPARNGYRFVGWDKTFDNVTANVTVTAKYVQQFSVIFKDYDGTILKTEIVDINTNATPPSVPSRKGYTFTGWSGTYTNVTQNQIVTATYNKNEILYTVVFKDYNGNTLKEQTVPEGTGATAPSNPNRAGYRFTGWDKAFDNIVSDITVTATYVQQFTVVFKDYDGTTLKTELVDKGTSATPPVNPSRDGYAFNGWDNSYTNITSNKIITATYVEKTSNYTVTFVNHDGTVLKTQANIISGASATAPTAPSREGYRFVGWDKSFDNVTSDITIVALYIQQFKVSFVDYNGTVIKEVWVDSGASATLPTNPSRTGYTFNGWRGLYSNVYANQTVQATYVETSNKATVKITNGTGIVGETVSLYVDLSNNSGFISASLLVDFDDTALKLIAVKDLGIISGAMHTEQHISPYVLTWENDERTSNITANGRLVELVFEISPNASEGVYDIMLNIPRDGIINANGQSQSFVTVNGFITVSEGIRDTHKWDKGTVITKPTENSTGLIVYTCRVCGETKTEILDKLSSQTMATTDFSLKRKTDEEDE